jgi:hypothetical protein
MSSSALPASLARFRIELEEAIRRELEADASARANGRVGRVLHAVRRRPGRTVVAFAAVAGTAAAALFVSSPWQSSPGFLEEVQAALTPAGSILHMKWEETLTSSDPACTVTYGPNEIWIDQTPPHRYRALLIGPYVELAPSDSGRADPRALACPDGTATELGGTDTGETLRFEPPNTLRRSTRFVPQVDPVADLRTWLSSGRAHEEGTTQLDGRTVERIRLDPPSDCPGSYCPSKPAYAYVDPETFYPVQIEYEGWGFVSYDGSPHPADLVTRFLTYEPLPRTAANVALTDIRALHPDAGPGLYPPPKLSGAVAKTVLAAKGAKSARVTFEVTATDDKGGDVPVSCWPRPGSRFPLGETMVHCGATDSRGNTDTAEFMVTVKRWR